MSNNIVVFVDNIGRTIIGSEVDSSTKSELAVKNPAVVNVQVGEDGQISVQLFPFVFREFVTGASREDGVVWNFNKSTITQTSGIELEERLTTQYVNLFLSPPPVPQAPPAADEEPEVVKLFDDEEASDGDAPAVEAEIVP
jgi:hypothetical protein